jgi:hypothetical protein
LLQIWRLPRVLGMNLLFLAFQALEVLARGLGQSTAAADPAELGARLNLEARRCFPLNSLESRFFPSRLISTGLLEQGGWVENVLGQYQAGEDHVALQFYRPLVQAAFRVPAAGSGLLARVNRWQEAVSLSLIRQIYYYRSAEYYGQTRSARLKSLWGDSREFSQRRDLLAQGLAAELLRSWGAGVSEAEALQTLSAFSRGVESLGVATEIVPVIYAGERPDGRQLTRIFLPRAMAVRHKAALLEKLEQLHFQVDEAVWERLVPRRFRFSNENSA